MRGMPTSLRPRPRLTRKVLVPRFEKVAARSALWRCVMNPGCYRLAAVFLLPVTAAACGAGGPVPISPPAPDFTRHPAPKPPGTDDFAERPFTEPLSLRDAEAVLRRTTVFAFGGMPPKRQVQAFNVVFEQPDAVSRFRSVGASASAAGQLYSLAGLLLLDPTGAMLLRSALSQNANTILVRDSDVVYERQVKVVADMIEKQGLGGLFRRARAEVNAYFADISSRRGPKRPGG